MSEVVGHRQALDATTARKRMTDDVHVPDLVEYKQVGGWTASPNELDAATSRLDAWHGTNVRYRSEMDVCPSPVKIANSLLDNQEIKALELLADKRSEAHL